MIAGFSWRTKSTLVMAVIKERFRVDVGKLELAGIAAHSPDGPIVCLNLNRDRLRARSVRGSRRGTNLVLTAPWG
jgi:hypothetical protein